MATKSTHKKTNFDKKKVSKAIDQIASKISDKGVYVIREEQGYYFIYEILNKRNVLGYIPTLKMADKICERINKKHKVNKSLKEAQRLIDKVCTLHTDSLYYKHILKRKDDRAFLMRVRIDENNYKTNALLSKIYTAL